MEYTIEKMDTKISFENDKKKDVLLMGYAFIDEMGHCVFIVYGERKRDLIIEYLSKNEKG